MTSRLHVGLVILAVAAVAVTGALAAADRPSQHELVVRATRTYVRTSDCCRVGRFGVRAVAIAAADPEYAAVALDGFDAAGSPVGAATAVLHRELGAWHVLTLGTDDLGCAIPAATVREQLGVGCADG